MNSSERKLDAPLDKEFKRIFIKLLSQVKEDANKLLNKVKKEGKEGKGREAICSDYHCTNNSPHHLSLRRNLDPRPHRA